MKETVNNIIYMARRFKLATALNLTGLTLAFALFYLLMTQIIYQFTYNHSIQDYERIYRLETDFVYSEWDYSDIVCRPFADAAKNLPEVESYSCFQNATEGSDSFEFIKGDSILHFPYTFGNNTVVSTFTDQQLSGSIQWDDKNQDGIIIPQSIALQYFDSVNVAGQEMVMLYMGEEYHYTVRGVYKDLPDNCELHNRIYSNSLEDYANHYNSLFKCYIKFKTEPKDLDAFCEKLKQRAISNLDKQKSNYGNVADFDSLRHSISETRFNLTPIGKTYFEHTTYTSESGAKGYQGNFIILALGCLFVVIIAAINFLNFTLAESPMRMRGINTRLVLGAERSTLRMRLVVECIIISLIACVTAILLCQLLIRLPSSALLLEGDISLSRHYYIVLVMLATSVVVGLVAGIYPSLFATSISPAIALKASFGLTPQGIKLRTSLVCIQLFLSLMMFIYIGILFMQTYYIYNSEYGYDNDRILTTLIPYETADSLRQKLYQEVNALPGIESVSLSDMPLGSTDSHNLLKSDIMNHPVKYRFIMADQNFLQTMGIEVIEGRGFQQSDSAAIIINKAAREQLPDLKLGTAISIGLDEEAGDSATVVGVCDYIRYGTMRISSDQMFFIVYKANYPYLQYMQMRIAPDADADAISQQINKLATDNLGVMSRSVDTFDNRIEKTYHNEFRFYRQTYLISIVCMILTLIGIFCLTMFETEYRRKEIGIRKVTGATTGEIVWMLCRSYGTYILICFAIAAPLAYFFGKQTLKAFADCTPIHWWIFPLALLFVGGITIGTVVLQSWRAAHENPVNSIKTE